MERGIKVVSYDSAVAPRGPHRAPGAVLGSAHRRNRGGADRGARAQARARASSPWCRPRPLRPIRIPGSPKCARRWPQHPGLEMVSVVYGDDVSDKSYREAVALLKQHPGSGGAGEHQLGGHRGVGARRGRPGPHRQGQGDGPRACHPSSPATCRRASCRSSRSGIPSISATRPRRSPCAWRAVTTPRKPVPIGRMGEVTFARGRRRRDEQTVHLRRQQRGGIREDLLTACRFRARCPS